MSSTGPRETQNGTRSPYGSAGRLDSSSSIGSSDLVLDEKRIRTPSQLLQAMRRAGMLSAVEVSAQFRTLRDMKAHEVIDDTALVNRGTIGTGAFGTVDLCDFISGGKSVPVAVKRLKKSTFVDEEEAQSFMAECALLRKLSHSSIVEFIGLGAHQLSSASGPARSLITEYCAGGSLKDIFVPEVGTRLDGSLAYVEQDFRIPKGYKFPSALEWLISVAQGLDYLHSASPMVVHRDIKMENILLAKTSDGRLKAKVADFGLSAMTELRTVAIRQTVSGKRVDAVGAGDERSLTRLLSAGKVRSYEVDGDPLSLTQYTGTVLYMAPEVIEGVNYNEQADIFSFGVLAFELMTGIPMISRFPTCHTVAMKCHALRVSEGVRPNMTDQLPPEIASLINRLWAQDPKCRPRARTLVEELKALRPLVQRWDKSLRRRSFVCCAT